MRGERRTLLIVGAGRLGTALLESLALRNPQHRYVLASRNYERTERKLNLVRQVCDQWNLSPDLRFATTDLANVDQTAELIESVRADLVFNATTPFPWWKLDELPVAERTLASSVGPGIWLALDCILPLSLSRAITAADSQATFINGCYPDATNAFLHELDAPPLIGIGNVANIVPGLRLAFAEHLRVQPRTVHIRMVCHHYTSLNYMSRAQAAYVPYFLEVTYADGRLTFREGDSFPFDLVRRLAPRERGVAGQSVTVSSAGIVLDAFLNNTARNLHTPGPLGLPGGYPVNLTVDGEVRLDLPASLNADEARNLNLQAQVFDGVEEVNPGVARYSAAAAEAHYRIVGQEVTALTTTNILGVARETVDRLNTRYDLKLGAL